MEPRVALPRSPSTLRPAAYRKLWLSWEMHGSGRDVDCGRLSRVQSSVPYPAPTLTQASVTSWRVGRGGQWGRRVVVVGSASLPMLLAAGFGLRGPEGGKLCRSLRQAGLGRQKRAGRDLFGQWGGRGSGRARAALQREWQGWLASNLSPDLAGPREAPPQCA